MDFFTSLVYARNLPLVGRVAYYTLKLLGVEIPRSVRIGERLLLDWRALLLFCRTGRAGWLAALWAAWQGVGYSLVQHFDGAGASFGYVCRVGDEICAGEVGGAVVLSCQGGKEHFLSWD